MNFQISLFNWQDHLFILTRGSMDAAAFRQLFAETEKATLGLQECKVLVDLSDSTYQIDPTEIAELAAATQGLVGLEPSVLRSSQRSRLRIITVCISCERSWLLEVWPSRFFGIRESQSIGSACRVKGRSDRCFCNLNGHGKKASWSIRRRHASLAAH